MPRFDLPFILNKALPRLHAGPRTPPPTPEPPPCRPDLPVEVLTTIIEHMQPTVAELVTLQRVGPAFLQAARSESLWRSQPVYKAPAVLACENGPPRPLRIADAFAHRMQSSPAPAKAALRKLTAPEPLSATEVSLCVLNHPRDFDGVAAAIARDPLALAYADAALRNDGFLVLEAVQRDGRTLKFASHALRGQRDIVLAAVRSHGRAFSYASHALQRDQEIAFVALETCPALYAELTPKLRGQRALFERALSQGFIAAYAHAPDALKSDRMALRAAVERWPAVYEHLPEWAQADRDIAALALGRDGLLLEHVPDMLFADRELVAIAVRQNGLALQHTSDELMDDLAMVLPAVRSNHAALPWVSERLRGLAVVAEAAFAEGLACDPNLATARFLSEHLRADLDIMTMAVEHNGYNYEHVHPSLLGDEDLALVAINSGAKIFGSVAPDLRADINFCAVAAELAADVLPYCPEAMRHDLSFVTQVVGQFPNALQFACQTLRDNEAVVRVAVTKDGCALQHASVRIQHDLVMVHYAIAHGATCESLHRRWHDSPQVVQWLFNRGADPLTVLRWAGNVVRNDVALMLRALCLNPAAIQFLSVDLMLRRPDFAQLYASYMMQWR